MSFRLDREIVAVARQLPKRGWSIGTTGNVSARDGETVRITPTRRAPDRMRRSDLVRVRLGSLDPGYAASLEWRLHMAIYLKRPDVGAVVHAHAPWATTWSCVASVLPDLEEAAYYSIGTVRTAPHGPAGSAELARRAVEALGGSSAVLLERHGLVAVGETPRAALTIAAAVEFQARVACLAAQARRCACADEHRLHGAMDVEQAL